METIKGNEEQMFVVPQTAQNCDIETSNCCTYKSDLITVINMPDLSSETLLETGKIRTCPVFESLLWRRICRAP